MRRTREIEVFGLAFLDMISCGLGGVIILMLIFSSMAESGGDQKRLVHASDQAESQGVVVPPFVALEIDLEIESGNVLLAAVDAEGYDLRRADVHNGSGTRYLVMAHDMPKSPAGARFEIIPDVASAPYKVAIRLVSSKWRDRVEQSGLRGRSRLSVDLLESGPQMRVEQP